MSAPVKKDTQPEGTDTVLQRVLQESRLWPSVYDALGTYRIRRLKQADSYELLWRLIHLWEATHITVALVSAAAIRANASHKQAWLLVREDLWGTQFDRMRNCFLKAREGALHGRMDSWLRVLMHVAQLENPAPGFLSNLQQALLFKVVDVSRFLTLWDQVCSPPSVRDPKCCTLIDFCRLMNSFRNRLAHLPLPPKPITELSEELEALTLSAWAAATNKGVEIPAAHNAGKGGWLCGGFSGDGILVRGSQMTKEESGALEFVYLPSGAPRDQYQRIDGVPFLHFDERHGSHVMTRLLKEPESLIEYTRFQSDEEPIVEVRVPAFKSHVPRPSHTEYTNAAAEVAAATAELAPGQAVIESLRESLPRQGSGSLNGLSPSDLARWLTVEGQYDKAIEVCEEIVKSDPKCHYAWGLLAIALRKRAARRPKSEIQLAIRDLDRSLTCIDSACLHSAEDYRAEVYYTKSKTLWRKWDLLGRKDQSLLKEAAAAAVQASRLSSADSIMSWHSYIAHVD